MAEPVETPVGRWAWRRLSHHHGLVAGLIILGVFVALAVLAPVLAPHDPYAQALSQRRIPPVWSSWFGHQPKAGWNHILGTDDLGRDYLSRLLYGARISLLIGVLATLTSGLIGTGLGVAAGYFGGRTDLTVNFIVTTRLSIPLVLVALALVSLYGGSIRMVITVLGLLLWDRFAVVMRSATLQARQQDYVTAARAIGCSTVFILVSEILPNIRSQLIIIATVEVALVMLLEAALSFLGLGVQPPEPSIGLMLAEGKGDLFFAPWMITIPGLTLFVLVLAINLVGDGLRDITAVSRGR